ncbi:hypothetical protein AC739_18520 [Planococcus glaciei]|nr:hypothetical protein AC739_18520 [Planococcus glaciei]
MYSIFIHSFLSGDIKFLEYAPIKKKELAKCGNKTVRIRLFKGQKERRGASNNLSLSFINKWLLIIVQMPL